MERVMMAKTTLARWTLGAGLLALLCGEAAAQSSVTVYGIADAGLVHDSGGPAGSVSRVSSGVGSGSRLGFRGKEDLGDGLTALFQLEAGYNLDTGTSGQGGVLFGRQAFVGLAGNFGTVTLGRQYSPRYKALANLVDPFEIGLSGNVTNVVAGFNRVDNQAEYITPVWHGLSADLAYGAGEVAGDSGKNRQLGAALAWLAGPLTVNLSYHAKNDTTATTAQHDTMLAAQYKFPLFTLSLAHSMNRGPSTAQSFDSVIGASVPFGVQRLLASYIRHNDTSAADRDAQQWAIGYLYALSKRSDLYASYGHIVNQHGAAFTVGNGTDVGTGSNGTNVGLRHRF